MLNTEQIESIHSASLPSAGETANPDDTQELIETGVDDLILDDSPCAYDRFVPKMQFVTPLIKAICCHNNGEVKRLIKAGAKLSLAIGGWRPVHFAAVLETPNDSILYHILEACAAEANEPTENGATPLHIACSRGAAWAVCILLRYLADVNAVTKTGATPLHNAATGGDAAIIDMLCAGGADPKAVDGEGRTPMDRAVLLRNKVTEDALRRAEDGTTHLNREAVFGMAHAMTCKTSQDVSSQSLVNRLLRLDAEIAAIEDKLAAK